jgi:dolichol-phosphate mannosyltransferase
MVVSIGARPLGIILTIGLLTGGAGVGFAILTVAQRLSGAVDVPGWTSLIATMLSGFGLVLTAVGVVAGYLGILVTMALGRPSYTTVTDDSIVFR